MQTPCGKCSACPCSKKDNQSPNQPNQPNQLNQPQQGTHKKSPKVECSCVSGRQRLTQVGGRTDGPGRSQDQETGYGAPVADTYTCSRARPVPNVRQLPMEERCTCRIKPQVQCECDPAPQVNQQEAYRQVDQGPPPPPTHAHITCGQPIPNQSAQPNTDNRYQNTNPQQNQYAYRPPCGHCGQKKKKCCIQ